ncbi:MAG: DUF4136 domain-containing protein [Ketobacter sp.]
MTYYRLLILNMIGFTLLASGCATSLRVSTDYDEQYSFENKRQYALTHPDDIKTTRNDITKGRIEKALRAQLKLRGFVETDKDKADIWISFFATTEAQQDYRTYSTYNSFYGYGGCYRCFYAPMMMSSTEVVEYTKGTLMIDVIDPATNTLKWRGSTSSKITTTAADSMTVTERTEKASAAVAAILANYPPGVTPPTAEEN